MFRLGIITDEITQDLEGALAFCKKTGLECFELRSAWGKGPFEFDDNDFSKIKELSAKYGIPLVSISSPFYKCSYFDGDERAAHLEGFKRLVSKAPELGVKYIRCFDFFDDERVTHEMIAKAFDEPVRLCAAAGLTILIESEPTTNSSNCEKTAALVRHINKPCVRALYEPGNEIYSRTGMAPYPDAYNYVKDIFCHIHIKDAVKKDGKVQGVVIGSGEADYKGMFRELLRTNYSGAVVLEPHYKKSGALTQRQLASPSGGFGEDGYDVALECAAAVREIIKEIQEESSDV